MTASAGLLYLRSYLLARVVIGSLGVLLPVVLVAGEGLLYHGPVPRRSLSDYYNGGLRDEFVGVLVVIGFFLVTYRVFERTWENGLSVVAGVAAIGVGLFPIGGGRQPTPLQARFGEGTIQDVHITAAIIFLLALAGVSYIFGRKEATRTDRPAAAGRTFWMLFHFTCAGLIVAALVFILVTQLGHVFDTYSVFIGEVVTTVAFGASWFVKGWEIDVLLGRSPSGAASGTG